MADGIENNFWYNGIDFNTGLKGYTEKPKYYGIPK